MHPTLFRLGELGIPSYGVAMAAGFLAALLLSLRSAQRQGISVNHVLDLSFWLLGAALVGSRLTFVALHAGEYHRLCAGDPTGVSRGAGQLIHDCTAALQLRQGGFVFFGGLVLSTLVGLWYTRRHGLSFRRMGDLVLPPVALGHFLGRLGCFAAGCCYGKPTSAATGLAFPPGSLAHQELVQATKIAVTSATMPLHPTQLYEALAELAIFVVLTVTGARKAYHGQVMASYLVLYPAARLVIELFRGDPDRGYLVQLSSPGLNAWLGLPPHSPALLSLSQLTALVVMVAAVLLSRRWRSLAA